ncbi:MAG: hypothetical protein KKD24_11400, partial [Proteobacteria bacterium]|nr:hypothetical protein [Pseudomonadota bacterium]
QDLSHEQDKGEHKEDHAERNGDFSQHITVDQTAHFPKPAIKVIPAASIVMTPTVSTFFHSITDIVLDLLRTGWMEQDVIIPERVSGGKMIF